jgi:peptidyl-tRNA hydrolase, PTH2 family
MVKQVIIVRKDVGMGKGKISAQVAHASVGAYRKAKKLDAKKVAEWEREGGRKIVLKGTLEEIMEFKQWADGEDVVSYLVQDAGHTQVEPGTVTALGLGPESDEKLRPTEKLKLL